MTKTRKRYANAGIARILETIVAATIIFIVFTASAFFLADPKASAIQTRTDLDNQGYNTLNQLVESGTIEATVEHSPQQKAELQGFIQNSLPASLLFKLTVTPIDGSTQQVVEISNTEESSFANFVEVSSTPLIYTSKNGNIYSIVLVLANAGQGV